jgi:hypothetical protein
MTPSKWRSVSITAAASTDSRRHAASAGSRRDCAPSCSNVSAASQSAPADRFAAAPLSACAVVLSPPASWSSMAALMAETPAGQDSRKRRVTSARSSASPPRRSNRASRSTGAAARASAGVTVPDAPRRSWRTGRSGSSPTSSTSASTASRRWLALQSRLPVPRAPMPVRHSDDENDTGLDPVDDAEWIASEQVPPCVVIEPRPRLGKARYGRFGLIDLVAETRGRHRTPLVVPTGSSLGLFEGFSEILNLSSHVRRLRECADAPPTMEPSWRRLHRLARAARESRLTTPPQRRRRPRSRDSGSVPPPERHALRRRAEAPQQAAAWNP